MFEATDVREWRGNDVIGADDQKIGKLASIYVDTATDQPSFATVRMGGPTRHRQVFVPLAGAEVGPNYLKVAHSKDEVKKAPSTDPEGDLPARDEAAVFAHYQMDYTQGISGERRLARR